MIKPLLFTIALIILSGATTADDSRTIEEVIAGIYSADSLQRERIDDLVMSADSYNRHLGGDDKIKEERLMHKTYYMKDTLFKTEIHEIYIDGERGDADDIADAYKEAAERRAKGHNRDASINPKIAFWPEHRDKYNYSMPGIEMKQGRSCYHVVADCKVEDEDLLEGDYWFESERLNLVYCRLRPAKTPSAIKILEMKMSFEETDDGLWLPIWFHLYGRGGVLLVIKFRFEVEEHYSNHIINSGLTDDFFIKEGNHEN